MTDRRTCTECEYVAQTSTGLAEHVKKRHPETLRPIPPAPLAADRQNLNPTRAAIYLRVSTIDQTPEQQLPKLRAITAFHGMEPVATYVDHASGKDMNRPFLQKMLEDAAAGMFDAVVYLRISRLGRNLRDVIQLWDYFERLKIATISATEPFDTRTPAGRLQRNILASCAEFEREMIVEQTREKMAHLRSKGIPIGGHPSDCGIKYPCPTGVDHSVRGKIARYRAKGRRDQLERLLVRSPEARRVYADMVKGGKLGRGAPDEPPLIEDQGGLPTDG